MGRFYKECYERNERIEDIHTVEEYLIYLNEQVEREKKLFDIGGSRMKSLEEQSERMQKFNSEQIALHEKNKTEEDFNGRKPKEVYEELGQASLFDYHGGIEIGNKP